MNNLLKNILNNTLGVKLDISYDGKYNLVQAKFQQELDFETKKLEINTRTLNTYIDQ